MATKRSPIRIKKSNVGKTRKATGTKKGQKVSLTKLRQMAKSKNPKTRQRAVFAINAKTKFRKAGKKS